MQVNQASSRGEGIVSRVFSICGRTLGFPLELRQVWPSKFVFQIKRERSLDFLDGTPGSPQEHCHTSRGTPSSAQQLENSPVYPKSSRDES